MAAALALYLLFALVAHAALAAVQGTSIPACSRLALQIRTSPHSVRPGGKAVLTAKIANKGSSTLSGLSVRLDLPTGLVALEQYAKAPLIIANGGATGYWTDLTLKTGERRVLKVKARACATATPGVFPIGGVAYLVNATNDVTCLSRAWTAKPAVVIIKPGKGSAAAAKKKAPACPTPAPAPDDGPGYTLYGASQRLADGKYVGSVGGGRRRELVVGVAAEAEDVRATACQTLCSGAGYEPIFYFAFKKADSGACYCSQDSELIYDAAYDAYEATEAGGTQSPTAAPTTTPSAVPTLTPSLAPSGTPSASPSSSPSSSPSASPTQRPTTAQPTLAPTWVGIASSYDGSVLFAAVRFGYVYYSSNAGGSWTLQAPIATTTSWGPVAMDSTGTRLVVAQQFGGYIYTSANSGSSWTQGQHDRQWQSLASSADGLSIAAGAYDNYVFISRNGGSTWTLVESLGSGRWSGLACSSDFSTIVAVSATSYVYISFDAGVSWSPRFTDATRGWRAVACDSTCTTIVVGVGLADSGLLYVSRDSGTTWTEQTNAGTQQWTSAVVAADGSKMAASTLTGFIYTSDYADRWTAQTAPGYQTWLGICASANFSNIAATANGGNIWTSP